MKSSLPEIFRKDLNLLSIPQKQSSQFSLYLRTNSFKPHQTSSGQNRYHKSSTHRINKSMDHALRDSNKNFNLTDDIKGKESLKRLLSQKKTTRSRSMFIEEKSNDQIEDVDSFKTIRKRVLQQLTMIEKFMPIVTSMQNAIKTGMEQFKQRQIEGLDIFEKQMLRKIAILLNTFKGLKKQAKTEVKVNKEQLNFVEEELATYKQLVEGFEEKESKFKFQIIEGGVSVTSNK